MKPLIHITKAVLSVICVITVTICSNAFAQGNSSTNWSTVWTEVNDNASWPARAGLQVVNHKDQFVLMGGRTPLDPAIAGFPGASIIWSDVWKSDDRGMSWYKVLESNDPGHWPARAYFQAVTKAGKIYVMGGQNFELIPNPDPNGPPFISQSVFYNDVWSSSDGINWTQQTDSAKWAGRAGLSAIVFKGEIYVMGGSFNDDPAVIGGPPTRVYFNDVYKSADGKTWELVTDSASWAPRAGAALAVKDGKLFLFGGEDGFTCIPGLRCPPYYNDVWSTRDGKNWQLVTEEADWPSRPGHRVEVVYNQFVLFGGFGLSTDPADPFLPSNPMDIWISKKGDDWSKISESPWNAADPAEIKYDFATLVANGGNNTSGPTIYSFGGDRETFNFADPTNYLNIDNDVWTLNITNGNRIISNELTERSTMITDLSVAPNPTTGHSKIEFSLETTDHVDITIYDLMGKKVRSVLNETLQKGIHSIEWSAHAPAGPVVSEGTYILRISTSGTQLSKRFIILQP
jgi:hypothetical protein